MTRHAALFGEIAGVCGGVMKTPNAKSVRGSLLPFSVSGTRVLDAECRLIHRTPLLKPVRIEQSRP